MTRDASDGERLAGDSAEAGIPLDARLPASLGWGIVVGGLVGLIQVSLLGRFWSACDIGINASANAYALLFLYLPALLVINTMVFGLAFAVLRRHRGSRHTALATSAGLLAMVVVGLVAFLVAGTPTGYPTQCD
jgi:hypothetical protein